MEEYLQINDELYGEYYFISNTGKVHSKDRSVMRDNGSGPVNTYLRGKEMTLGVRNGYAYVNLCAGNIRKKYYVHRLVATTFLANLDDKPQVNHIDGNKLNNNVDNLEWVTAKENKAHALKTGLCYATKENYL